MTQHTPAPWHVGDGPRAIIVYDERGFAIANAITYHRKHDDAAGPANAALIAAAPDLLLALQMLLDLQEHREITNGTNTMDWRERVAAAKAAVAKATK